MNEARLYEILRLKRQHGSLGEAAMIAKVLVPYNPTEIVNDKDEVLAFYISVADDGTLGGDTISTTLFSAHVDTVHGRSYSKTVKDFTAPTVEDPLNDIDLNRETGMVHAKGDVLGADDGAGVWLLLEMIDAGVPGHYLFHRGEECGGVGSTGIAKHHRDLLTKFNRAIAFDRKATHSVITHQAHGRCCSDDFADALAAALTCDMYFYKADDGGVFTDTANYTDDIGECTNVSVGYYNEHTKTEKLDLDYLFALRDKCIKLDWDALPTVRKPGEVDPADSWLNYGFGGGYGGTYPGMSQKDYDREFEHYKKKDGTKPLDKITADDLYDLDYYAILDLCEEEPYIMANLVIELLYGPLDDQGGGTPDELDPVGINDGMLPKDIWDDEDDDDSSGHLAVGMR